MMLLLVGCDIEGAADPAATTEVIFEVPAGATARGLGDDLVGAGLIQAEWKWGWYLRTGGDGTCIKAGRHKVGANMPLPAVLAALCGAPIPKDEPFTIPEGWRARDIDAALAAKGWIKAGAYLEASRDPSAYTVTYPLPEKDLEGYLYPETYRVEPDGFDPKKLVQRQLDTLEERFVKGRTFDRPLHDIVTMASMIEREEPKKENRPIVAGILWKRIDGKWNLGVDATSRYTLDDWNDEKAFRKKLFDPADPWNTRLKPGLPPTPIGNPGAAALEAAAAPEANEFWYYLHDAEGNIHPARTEAEHNGFKRRYNVY